MKKSCSCVDRLRRYGKQESFRLCKIVTNKIMADCSRKMVSAVTESQTDDDYAIFQLRFPQKLWHLLSSGSDAILWGGAGQTILLNSRVLSTYLWSNLSIFKTRNLSSFIRQLNLYGFRKDPMCNSSNPHMQEYAHECFLASRPDLLGHIGRRVLPIRPAATAADTLPKQASASPKKVSELERARGALRSALARAALRLAAGAPPAPPPTSAPAVRFLFTDLSDREEETELDLELASRPAVRPHPYLAPHPCPFAARSFSSSAAAPYTSSAAAGSYSTPTAGSFSSSTAGDAAPYKLNGSTNQFEEDLANNRGAVREVEGEAEEAWPVWLPCPTAHPLHSALPPFATGTGLHEVEASDGDSDLKELYFHISRTMDLLNS